MSAAPTPLSLSVLVVAEQALAARLAAEPNLAVQPGDMADAPGHDVVVLHAADGTALAAWALHAGLPALAYDHAVVMVLGGAPGPGLTQATETAELDLLRLGVEAVVTDGGTPQALARALRHAHQRKQVERSARVAYATDLATGLPHQAQLLEHMTQLIALREREAAPLVLIALGIEGVLQATAHLGGEAANVLRRKIAVRLRGGLRASDVVASLGTDLFAVMLGRVDLVTDGEGVAAKLLRGLEQPFVMAGRNCRVSARVGLASYPAHGKEAPALLQRAVAQASMLATVGEQGVGVTQSGFGVLEGGAANDPD